MCIRLPICANIFWLCTFYSLSMFQIHELIMIGVWAMFSFHESLSYSLFLVFFVCTCLKFWIALDEALLTDWKQHFSKASFRYPHIQTHGSFCFLFLNFTMSLEIFSLVYLALPRADWFGAEDDLFSYVMIHILSHFRLADVFIMYFTAFVKVNLFLKMNLIGVQTEITYTIS
ncbi:hypothetical protein ACJX0J_029039 [Zea mays]